MSEQSYPFLYGRLPIYTSIEELDPSRPEEVIAEVNEALSIHVQNLLAMEYLYWYRRGVTPIYGKTKDVREEINNKISENLAGYFTEFHNGYFLAQPAYYVSRKDDDETSEKVRKLNEYLYLSGKPRADNKLVDWFDTVGKAVLYVKSNDSDETPVSAFALDPRSAFIVRSMRPGNEPVFSVNSVVRGDKLLLDVWTKEYLFRLSGSVTGELMTPDANYTCTATSVDEVLPNEIGEIPIVEYYYNSVQQSCFEAGIPLLDAINKAQSDRMDAIDQTVQTLLVFYNATLGQDANGDDITVSRIKEAGAIFLKSVGENKADIKQISSDLDQSQTQTFIDDLYRQALIICGMPDTSKNGGYNGDTGLAVELRDGYKNTEMIARNTEDLFKESNAQFDKILVKILSERKLLDIDLSDFSLNFVRNEVYGIQSKAQAYQTLVAGGFHPTIAMQRTGVSPDPINDFEMSKDYMRLRWGDPDAPAPQPTTEIVEEDRFTGDE